jgi:hypothetical protein
MDCFDTLEIDAAPGTKLSRAEWGGAWWIVAPVDRTSRQTFDATLLHSADFTRPWPDPYWDTAQCDWEIIS